MRLMPVAGGSDAGTGGEAVCAVSRVQVSSKESAMAVFLNRMRSTAQHSRTKRDDGACNVKKHPGRVNFMRHFPSAASGHDSCNPGGREGRECRNAVGPE